MISNAELAAAFHSTADLLEFENANPFRVRAYRNAARLIEDAAEPLARRVDDPARKLTDLDGIGEDLAEKITTLVRTGELPMLRELQARIPPGVLDLLRVPGLGPKKAATLYRELQIDSLAALRTACEQQRVRALKGFGPKTETTLLAGLDFAQNEQNQRLYWSEAEQLVAQLRAHLDIGPTLERYEFAGSFRRLRETVGDLDILAVTDDAGPVMDHLAGFSQVETILARGETKLSLRLRGGVQVDLRVVPAASFGAALQYFTGSKEHNVTLRGLAKDHGLKLNEYGLFRSADDKPLPDGATEVGVYAALGLSWIPPELRENRREFTLARTGELPALIELAALRGDLHMHTTASDGQHSLTEMVAAARARGLQYMAVTDHSKRVSMANGLDEERLLRQWEEIDRLNEQLDGFTVLKGIEVDILEPGGLDLRDDVLLQADWVVASVHYGQQQPREQITKRIVDALAHPAVSVIGHPTGRLLNRRNAYAVDLEAVYEAAARYGKALELNSNPARLDLDDVCCATARGYGIPLVISSDAHHTGGFDVLRYGINQARRAGLTADDVLNTRPWSAARRLIKRTSG